jgi:small conductance mechanosensitive channel
LRLKENGMEDELQQIPGALEQLVERFLAFLPDLLSALVLFIAGLYLVSLVVRLVTNMLRRRNAKPEAIQVIRQVVRWSLVTVVTITALEQINFDLTAFVAGLGVVGFTIGFALKDISENFVAGLVLLLQRPFELGDLVRIDEFEGRVIEVSLRATEMETLDGQNVLLPNALVLTTPLYNFSRTPLTRIPIDVGVAYDSDLDEVRRVTLNAIAELPAALGDPPPFVIFHTFDSSSINLTAYFWIDERETRKLVAKDLGVTALKRAYDRAGVEIPYPIQTQLLRQP